jgi:DNA ligase (NAD+)
VTEKEAKDRILSLKKVIDEYRYSYHVLDKSSISDEALDTLKHELQELERQFPQFITDDSPTQRVGGIPLDKFEKVTHLTPMLSMEDVFTFEEVLAWQARIEKHNGQKINEFYLMPKIDGLAVTLWYKNGELIKAITRGDGKVGEDVTNNVKTIESIPLKLREHKNITSFNDSLIEVRGEVYITKKDFNTINKDQQKKGEKIFANPRNLAAGSIRQLDPRIAASRKLRFIAWNMTNLGQENLSQSIDLLSEIGFKTVPGEVVDLESAETIYKKFENDRQKFQYWLDGTVLRVNNLKTFDQLGVVGKAPRGLVAWKFPPEEATTVIRDVEWHIGRTGKLTPVATVDPVFLAGTTVTHASLHNQDEIDRLDLRIGDTAIIVKSGDIIPKIIKIISELRTGKEIKAKAPENCPICHSQLTSKEGNVDIFCTNKKCFSTEKNSISFAVKAFGIDGLGEKIIEKLMKADIIGSAADIFSMNREELLGLEGFGELSVNKLLAEIDSRKVINFDKFILSLGIPHVGQETAINLSYRFKSIEELQSASMEDLLNTKDIGEVVAKSVLDFFQDDRTHKLLKDYFAAGVKIIPREMQGDHLSGLTFVVTGTLESFSREEAEEQVRSAGGEVSSSVSKKTSYVVVGDNAGSKAKRALELGIKTISEAEFVEILKINK